MARAARGRKPAKNETAAALISALKFGSVLKAPTTTSIEQANYAWLNSGYAIMFDGVVAAGHPIPADIAGYPHTKLLLEALENTEKKFELTVHNNGMFEINSDKYQAVVHSLDYGKVIPTSPDPSQGGFERPTQFIAALEAALKVTVETGDVVTYSAINFGPHILTATNGKATIQYLHGNSLPPVTIPRQFAAAIVKAGKEPKGLGVSPNWDSLTVWYEDGSWLRTNLYRSEDWPASINERINELVDTRPAHLEPIPVKMWAAFKALLPFADDDNRIIVRPGIVQTHLDRSIGASLELTEMAFRFDIDGKIFTSLETMAATYGLMEDGEVLAFEGENVRGFVACKKPLEEPAQTKVAGDWGAPVPTETAPASTGWGNASAPAMLDPPKDEKPPQRTAAPQGEWKGGPTSDIATDPEFLSQKFDVPASNFTGPVEYDDSYVLDLGDNGIDIGGVMQGETPKEGFKPSGWLDTLTDDDAGININDGWK